MSSLDELVETLLWEGHQLFPYTPGAPKNATPTPFGIVYPPAYAEGGPNLHSVARLESVAVGSEVFRGTLHFVYEGEAHRCAVDGPGEVTIAPGSLRCRARLAAEPLDDLQRVTLQVENLTDVPAGLTRAEALRSSLLSVQLVLRCDPPGRFASAVSPPPELAAAVAACECVNTFPVLATPSDDTVLGAAICLPDHPQIAPESRGGMFDSTEIEEALLLHVLALSDAERAEIARADPAVRAMIERAARATPDDVAALRGRVKLSD